VVTDVERELVKVVFEIEVVLLYKDILYEEDVLIYASFALILIVNPDTSALLGTSLKLNPRK
jgi:hypothetical protein